MRKLTKKIVCGVAAVAIMVGVFVGHTMINKADGNDNGEGVIQKLGKTYGAKVGCFYNKVTGQFSSKGINFSKNDTDVLVIKLSDFESIRVKEYDINNAIDQYLLSIPKEDRLFMDGELNYDVVDKMSGSFAKYSIYSEFCSRYISQKVRWLVEPSEIKEYLYDTTVKELMEGEPEEVYNKYGTHVINEVLMGRCLVDKLWAKIEEEEKYIKICESNYSDNNMLNKLCDEIIVNGMGRKEDIYDGFDEFRKKAEDDPTTIGIEKGGLIPVWTLLEEYKGDKLYTDDQIDARIELLKNAYESYAKKMLNMKRKYN